MQKSIPTAWQPAAAPQHYAVLAEEGVAARRNSRISELRLINNDVKRALIADALRAVDAPRVLVADVCCGRGGDIQKIIDGAGRANLTYVGADCSPEQISHARARWPSMPGVHWVVADCFAPGAHKAFTEAEPLLAGGAHLVSCQFALHYAFDSASRLGGFLDSVSELCAAGGYFAFTTTDASFVNFFPSIITKSSCADFQLTQ